MKKKLILKTLIGISLISTSLFISDVKSINAANNFKSGSGTKNNPYIISNAEQLQNVSKYCGKKYDNVYFKIEAKNNQIDLKNENFNPICSLIDGKNADEVFEDAFYGNFDGNNTEIINLKIETDEFFGGLFGGARNAVIENIGIGKNSKIIVNGTLDSGVSPTGGIVGKTWETNLTNVWNKATIEANGSRVGGIVGEFELNATLKDAFNSGKISAGKDNSGYSYVGGIVGFAQNTVEISTVENSAIIDGKGSRVGGIAGTISESVVLKKATNSGNINIGKDNDEYGNGGGIVGLASSNVTIEDVSNTGSIKGDSSRIGGIAGEINTSSKAIKIINSGKVNAGKDKYGYSYVGGAVGLAGANTTIEDVSNSANVTAKSKCVGGIAGKLQEKATIKNAVNIGDVTTNKDENNFSVIGGVVGYAYDNIKVENVINSGKVNGDGYNVGGIIGEMYKSNTTNIANYNESISGKKHVGLLIGILNDSANITKNSYTLKENTKLLGVGYFDDDDKLENMKGFTKKELKNKDNFVGFDFDKVWTMGTDYPILKTSSSEEETTTNTGFSDVKLTIEYNDKSLDIDNFIYKDRTYVDLYKFCSITKICNISVTFNNNKKIYNISKKIIPEDSNGYGYNYLVEHEHGSDKFKSSIQIGGRQIVDDENTQSSDVKSCPNDIDNPKYKCTDGKFFVPVRFLTQALGLKVKWDGNSKTVKINDDFIETFNTQYETVITEGSCNKNIESCKKLERNNNGVYELSKNKKYYFNLIKRDNGEVQKYSKFLSFYTDSERKGDNEPYSYINNPFTIKSNQIQVTGSRKLIHDIAQITIYKITGKEEDYKKDDYNIGSYPMISSSSFTIK